VVEILYVEGCPNSMGARALVDRLAGELELEPRIRMVRIPDLAAATRTRFLGSPTVRVDGRDVELGQRIGAISPFRAVSTRQSTASPASRPRIG